jgi:hypothetical protein
METLFLIGSEKARVISQDIILYRGSSLCSLSNVYNHLLLIQQRKWIIDRQL